MARYDKYDPIAGGFRAKLAAALTLSNGGFLGAVSLNASGRVVAGTAGQTGAVGVLVKNAPHSPAGRWDTTVVGPVQAGAPMGTSAGDVVDIMTHGEIVDLPAATFPAGSKVYAATSGALSTTGGAGTVLVGWTVEAGRLVVRIGAPVTPAA